jgi:NADP-dependent 3-hydroxy acid dehydrogenase YdfG
MSASPLRVALVTGAGSGIGRAAAKALLSGGFKVVMTGRRLDALQSAIQLIGGNDSNCLAVACDVGKPEDVKNLFSALKAKWGRIDSL